MEKYRQGARELKERERVRGDLMRCNRGKSDVKVERLREMVREEHTERMTAQGARGWGDKKKEERGNIAQVNCRCGES